MVLGGQSVLVTGVEVAGHSVRSQDALGMNVAAGSSFLSIHCGLHMSGCCPHQSGSPRRNEHNQELPHRRPRYSHSW